MTTDRSVALVVEGMGSDSTFTKGIAWFYGHQTIAVPDGREFIGGTGSQQGLISVPRSVGGRISPFDVTAKDSAQSFKLHADIFTKDLWWNRPDQTVDVLNVALTKGATTIEMQNDFGWSSAQDGDVVWLGDEAILLGSHVFAGQFSGCTRGLYSTTDAYHPLGTNIWDGNPRRINRAAFLLTYNHDTDVIKQVWQGFVSKYWTDNSILHVQCRGLLATASRALVNRGHPKKFYVGDQRPPTNPRGPRNASVLLPTEQIAGGNYSNRVRVNKANATTPHWSAWQMKGAAFYARLQDDTQFDAQIAKLEDNGVGIEGAGSSPILGGQEWDRDERGDVFELLVVDKKRDRIGTGDNLYANFRSSTRDLKRPFHPVAISMALLTSTFDPDPGVAGSGAAGSLIFGTTLAFLQTTNYFIAGGGADYVACMRRVPGESFIAACTNDTITDTLLTTGDLTYGANSITRASGSWIADGLEDQGHILIVGGTNPGSHRVTSFTATVATIADAITAGGPETVTSVGIVIDDGLRTIPTDGTAAIDRWQTPGATVVTGTSSRYQLIGGGNAIAPVEDTGDIIHTGRRASGDNYYVAQLPKTLSVADWDTHPDGHNADHQSVAVSDDGTVIAVVTGDDSPQAEIVLLDETGAETGSGDGLNSTPRAVEVCDSGGMIVEAASNDEIAGFLVADLDTANWTVDMTVDPANPTTIEAECRLVRDPTDSTVLWFVPGPTTGASVYLYKFDATDGTILGEFDVAAMSGLTLTQSDLVWDMDVDKNGEVYVLLEDTATNDCDVVRVDSDGAKVLSAVEDGITQIVDNSRSLTCGDEGHIFIGDINGDITVISQT